MIIYYIYKRPHLDFFLNNIHKHYQLGVWSSADDEYVTEIVNLIKPDSIEFEIVWGRSKCSLVRDLNQDCYLFEKRLDKLKRKGFKMEDILIVDDTPSKTRNNYGNAIYIKEFTGDQLDMELNYLNEYFMKIKNIENFRTLEKRGWRTQVDSLKQLNFNILI